MKPRFSIRPDSPALRRGVSVALFLVVLVLAVPQPVAAATYGVPGRVVTAGGKGVPGVTVTTQNRAFPITPAWTRTTTTDANGNYVAQYSWDNFQWFGYAVSYSKANHTFNGQNQFDVSLVVGQPSSLPNVTVLTGPVAGLVSGGGGVGISGVTVARLDTGTDATPNIAIPDNNATGISSSASFGGGGTIGALSVEVDIVHTWRGDLVVDLVHPDGTSVRLWNRTGGSADHLQGIFPFQLTPAESLEALRGKPRNGTWLLRVQDLAGQDTGTLVSWSIRFGTPTTTDAGGNYAFGQNTGYWIMPDMPGWVFVPPAQIGHPGDLSVNFSVTRSPPTLSAIAGASTSEDTSGSLSFTVGDGQTAAGSLVVTATTDNPALFPPGSLVLGGSGANRTLTFTPTEQLFGTANATLTVTDGDGQTFSRTFLITVHSVNDLPVAGSPFALNLNGVDDHAVAHGIGLPSGNQPHTIEAWMFRSARPIAPGRDWILHLGSQGNGHHWLVKPNGTIQFGAWARLDAQVQDVPLPTGVWTHVVTTWDQTNYVVYFDGVKVGQATPTSTFNMAVPDLWLGAKFEASERQFAGQLDEVRVWNRALTQGEIQSNRWVPLRGNEPGLLVYLPFDEGQGRTAYDYAVLGGRSHASLSSGVSYVSRDDTELVLNGTSAAIQVPHSTQLNAYPFTVAAWINTTKPTGVIASKYADGSGNGWTFRLVEGRLRAWYLRNSSEGVHEPPLGVDGGPVLVNDGVWRHVAFTVDETGGKIFIDGVETGSRTWSGPPGPPTSTQPLWIGRYQLADPVYFFNGRLDDVTIWNRVLSAGDLQELRLSSPSGSESGLVAYYRFDDAAGSVARDSAGGQHNGTYQGGAAASTDGTPFFEFTVVEDTATPIYLQGFDIENMLGQAGGTLNYTIVSPPVHGTLRVGVTTATAGYSNSWTNVVSNPLTYTPPENYNGPDSFTYRLTDGNGGQSKIVTVLIFVQDLNDNPTITTIANRTIEADTATGPIAFTVDDEETTAGALSVSALSSDTRLVPPSGIVFGGSGANRTITVTPAEGEIGTVTITVTVMDTAVPAGSTSIDFSLRVEPKPAYALVDLGVLGNLNRSIGHGLNDRGWSVGLAQSGSQDGRALLYRGLTGTHLPEDLDPNRLGAAYAINDDNVIIGSFRPTPGGLREASLWQNGVFTSLATRITGNDSVGYDLNLLGDVVGSMAVPGSRQAFFLPTSGPMVNLGALSGLPTDFTASSEALGLTALGVTVGYGQHVDGRSRAFRWSGGSSLEDLGLLPGHNDARAHAINDNGLVTGYSSPNQAINGPRRAFVYELGVMHELGILPDGTYSVGWDINSFGQVVGTADRGTVPRGFIHTAGQMRDLNDLIHDTEILPSMIPGSFRFASSGWELTEARAINSGGSVVGTARREGRERAFLAVPAWVVGRQIARPEGAVAKLPEIELIRGNTGDTAQNAFFWSEYEKRLYAVRPVAARIKWFTSFDLTTGSGTNMQVITERIAIEGISVWPKDPVIHVATVPVEIEPRGVPFDYGFQTLLHETTGGSVTVDPTSKTFNSARPGYTVAYYLRTEGGSPNPSSQRPYFEVIRTVLWNDPEHLREREALVGEKLADFPQPGDPGHQDYLDKQGWVFHPLSFYDGAGDDRAHDRASRRGPIIPVNLDTEQPTDDLVVVWYRFSRIGVAWGGVPVRYRVAWPNDDVVDKIVIASGLGSGPLPSTWRNLRAYSQPNTSLPGYNPNEEHALVLPANGGGGQAIFALRYDLNEGLETPASEPYALLKYRDPATDEWNIKPYKVIGEEAPYFFRFSGWAGREIAPPYPLSILTLCEDSAGVSGPYWEDWQGRLYARAAGAYGEPANVVIRWFYPLLPDFFYDLDLDGQPDQTPGTCIPWLDRRSANTLAAPNQGEPSEDTPIDVTYRISWPDAPLLQIGETLTDAKSGLPGVKNMASLEFVYDDLTPDWNPLETDSLAPIDTIARLYDPLSTRTYRLTEKDEIPDEIKRTNRGGKEYFDDLPPTLENRLTFDPVNRWLNFTGVLDTSGAGEPLLLPNVLFSRERDEIKNLAPDDTGWTDIVAALFELTRNPHGVDLAPQDGQPDRSTDPAHLLTNSAPGLRLGLVSTYVATNATNANLTVTLAAPSPVPAGYVLSHTNVVPERLGSLPKALTASLGGVTPPEPRPLKAFSFDGDSGYLQAGPVDLSGASFTLEFWAQAASTEDANYVAGLGTTEPNGQLIVGFDATGRFVFRFSATDDAYGQFTPDPVADTEWHHWAVTFNAVTLEQAIFRDGERLVSGTSLGALQAAGPLLLGRRAGAGGIESFHGELDEIRLWNHVRSALALARDRFKALTGHESGLVRYYRANDLTDSSPSLTDAVPFGAVDFVDSTAPTAIPPRYLVLAENNSPDLAGLPIRLHIIQVDDGPFQGDLKVIYPGNVFDQRLTLRHSSEFGGDPNPLQFEWYYKPDDAGFDPTDLPIVNAAGEVTDPRGWLFFTAFTPPTGQGVNDVTIGTAGQSGLLTLGDNWFVCRHRGFNVRGATPWSGWIGDPSGGGTPRAQLAEGWVKRVIRGLNPFDARTADFHSTATATYASMILQAGERYEGDIAFNPSGDHLNQLGLIEAYATVLERGKELSIEGTPPVNFNPANNALLLAASRIADLYMLLGNEAYADAQDPTIGFTSATPPYEALATSIFTFQNQLDSLLSEELTLLRGRDDTSAGVAARPVYNRLFWNFTLGEGEVAYQQSYNIGDQNEDGFINETDARILYPQGHGDAWGHYLTGIKVYYDLLRHPFFTWVPRTERVLVAGVPVEVDYLDERKFAQAAAARAKAGREIVDLTYRASYVDDPNGQWQGYRDTDGDRAWGVADWASRAGQSAYFDWLTANAILPAVDANPTHTGIRRIDRTTVADLDEIIAQYDEVQSTMDKADVGLNPLGLAKGAMVLDIDPTFLAVGSTATVGRQTVQGLAHFEQLNERAIKTLKNAQRIWNEANAQSRNLRANQDSVDEFTRNARSEELNYRNRLIEIFGYPYAGDIGPGKTYPSGYAGPDLYHYMYVPVTEITGETLPAGEDFSAFFDQVNLGLLGNSHFPTEEKAYFTEYADAVHETDPVYLPITYPQVNGPWTFSAPPEWGQRRAPGRLQEAISDVLQATARLKFAGQNYDGLILDINDSLVLLKARFDLDAEQIRIHNAQRDAIVGMNALIGIARGVELGIRRLSEEIDDLTDVTTESLPKVLGLASDVTAPARGLIKLASEISQTALDVAGDVAELTQTSLELGKEEVALNSEIKLLVADQRYEVLQQVKELEIAVRDEINLRLEVFRQEEALRQAYGRYLATVAEGQRVLDELVRFRKLAAAQTTEHRYRDMAFRIFRNEALQKYRATFDLAARYVYLCATAYDYESNFLGNDRRAASRFFDQIIRQRQLGVLIDDEPIPGHSGLADIQGRMIQNWEIIKPQFGLNNPQLDNGRFSLRRELFRLRDDDPERLDDPSDENWRALLKNQVVQDVWRIPEFRRYCRPFAPESAGPQPALVIRFPTTIQFGQNYFGHALSGGDSAFDPTYFSTKVNAVGIGFPGYDETGLSRTPRVYLVPVGMDVLRAPTGSGLATREWRVLDQAVPVPFAIGANDFTNPQWIASQDSLSETYGQPRRFAALRAFSYQGDVSEAEMTASTRLVARSVWNTEWMLIVPGGTLLSDPHEGLERFIHSVGDIRLLMMVYSYAGQ